MTQLALVFDYFVWVSLMAQQAAAVVETGDTPFVMPSGLRPGSPLIEPEGVEGRRVAFCHPVLTDEDRAWCEAAFGPIGGVILDDGLPADWRYEVPDSEVAP